MPENQWIWCLEDYSAGDQSVALAYKMNTTVVWILLVQIFILNSEMINKLG